MRCHWKLSLLETQEADRHPIYFDNYVSFCEFRSRFMFEQLRSLYWLVDTAFWRLLDQKMAYLIFLIWRQTKVAVGMWISRKCPSSSHGLILLLAFSLWISSLRRLFLSLKTEGNFLTTLSKALVWCHIWLGWKLCLVRAIKPLPLEETLQKNPSESAFRSNY